MTRRALAVFEIPLGLLALAALMLARLWAAAGIPVWIPAAPLVRLGIASPFTGMTRSFVAMASGDPLRAFAWHPLGPLAFVVCAVAPFVAAASFVRGRRLPAVARVLHSNVAWIACAAVITAVWIRQIVAL